MTRSPEGPPRMAKEPSTANRKKRNRGGRSLLPVVVALISSVSAIYIVWNVFLALKPPVRTEIVREGSLEDSVTLPGYILRNETLIYSPTSGILSCYISDGERVAKNTRLATVRAGKLDEATQARLSRLNEQIFRFSSFSNLRTADTSQGTENQISTYAMELISASHDRDMSRVASVKHSLLNTLSNRSNADSQKMLSELISERDELERSISSYQSSLYAEEGGVFISRLDGYEKVFDVVNRRLLTPASLDNVDNADIRAPRSIVEGEPAVKIVDNYEWYFAANISSSFASGLKLGEMVTVRFADLDSPPVKAMVESVSAEQNGRATLVLMLNTYAPSIYSIRKTTVDIIKRTYHGLKVPKSAIRVPEGGETGVFTMNGDVAKFKSLSITYSGDDYIIASVDPRKQNRLLLYDHVIVGGSNIWDGKIVR